MSPLLAGLVAACATAPSLPRLPPIPSEAAYGECGNGRRVPLVPGEPAAPYLRACGGALHVYDASGASLGQYAQLQ